MEWSKPPPAKKRAIMAMIHYYANKADPVAIKATNIAAYLSGQPTDSLPISVHLGNTLVFTNNCESCTLAACTWPPLTDTCSHWQLCRQREGQEQD